MRTGELPSLSGRSSCRCPPKTAQFRAGRPAVRQLPTATSFRPKNLSVRAFWHRQRLGLTAATVSFDTTKRSIFLTRIALSRAAPRVRALWRLAYPRARGQTAWTWCSLGRLRWLAETPACARVRMPESTQAASTCLESAISRPFDRAHEGGGGAEGREHAARLARARFSSRRWASSWCPRTPCP